MPETRVLCINLTIMGCSEVLLFLFEFSVQDRRGWPDMPVTFLYLCKEK